MSLPSTDPTPTRHHLTPEEIPKVGHEIARGAHEGSLMLVNARQVSTGQLHTLLAISMTEPGGTDAVIAVAGRLFGPDDDTRYHSPTREDNVSDTLGPGVIDAG